MASLYSDFYETDPEYIDLLNFIIERTKNVELPMNIQQLAREFKEKSGAPLLVGCLVHRIKTLRTRVQSFKRIDTNTKVKVIFALSASVNVYFLRELRKNALVGVDDKLRIIHYKANDGSLELRGDQSRSARNKTVKDESKRTILSWIIDYFENKNDSNAVPANKEEKKMWSLIEFITEKCDKFSFPLCIRSLAKEFYKNSGTSGSFHCIYRRVEEYCREIQNTEFLDTHSKVKQLFGLSAKLDSDCLKELRKDAVVEVDDLNRITKYTSKNGGLTLHGDHSISAKRKLGWIGKRKNKKTVKKHCNSDRDKGKESEYSEDDSDEYSDEEFGCEFSNNSMRLNEMDDYDSNYSIDDQIKLEPFRGSILEDLNGIEEEDDIQQIPKPFEVLDEHIEETTIKIEHEEPVEVKPETSIHGNLNEIKGDGFVQQIPRSLQALDEHNQIKEDLIKVEQEDPVEVKPETSHNSKIKFFEAMQSLILCLDTPSLSWIQSKIQQKIQNLEGSHEMILNSEVGQIIDLLIARLTTHSVVNLSENVESVNLSNFLCYLKASILNSKMSGVDGLVKNIRKLIEKSQNKRIPMEKVANALRDTLDVDGF